MRNPVAIIAIGAASLVLYACNGLVTSNPAPPLQPPIQEGCVVGVDDLEEGQRLYDIRTDTLATWNLTNLDAAYENCAACHFPGTVIGSGDQWGKAADPDNPNLSGWYEASLRLAIRDAADAPGEHTLYTHFTPLDGNHTGDDAAAAEMLQWLQGFQQSGGAECAGNAPPACDLDLLITNTQQNYVASTMDTVLNACASCHATGTPTGEGFSWGKGDSADWHLAVATLAADDNLDDPAAADLVGHFGDWDGPGGTHTLAAIDLAAGPGSGAIVFQGAQDYLAAFRDNGGTACAGNAAPVEAGDGDGDGDGDVNVGDGDGDGDGDQDCVNPPAVAVNQNYFQQTADGENLEEVHEVACGLCHGLGNQDAIGAGTAWGPRPTTWFDAVESWLAAPGPTGASAEGCLEYADRTERYQAIWDATECRHPRPQQSAPDVAEWLDFRDNGCVDGAPPVNPGDGDPEPDYEFEDCEPLPIGEADSLDYWRSAEVAVGNEFLNSTGPLCSGCHAGVGKTPTGGGFSWGITLAEGDPEPLADDWHGPSYAKWGGDPPGVNEVLNNSLYRHFGDGFPDDGNHPLDVEAADKVAAWFNYLSTGCK